MAAATAGQASRPSTDASSALLQPPTFALDVKTPVNGNGNGNGSGGEGNGDSAASRENAAAMAAAELTPVVPTKHIQTGAPGTPALVPTSPTHTAAGVPLPLSKTSGEHLLTIAEATKRFDTNLATGLTSQQAAERQKRDGKNVLTPPRTNSIVLTFLRELVAGFGLILWCASLLCFLAWKPIGDPPDPNNLYLGVVLLIVIFFQATFNTYQEYSSSQVLESFKRLLPSKATVMRDGRATELEAADLAVGDIVKVTMGANAPADMLLFRVNNLKIDKASITGESDPVVATLAADPNTPSLVEASNLVLLGTRVVEGDGTGVVIRIGDQCAVASVVAMAAQHEEETTLSIEIQRFIKIIVTMAVVAGGSMILTWAFWLRTAYPETDEKPAWMTLPAIMTNIVAVIVAFVPDGLPVSVTMTLSLIAYRLVHKYEVIVTKLGTVETLGSVSIIASDKTGTITENKMKLRRIVTLNHVFDTAVSAEDVEAGQSAVCQRIVRNSVLCNAVDITLTKEQRHELRRQATLSFTDRKDSKDQPVGGSPRHTPVVPPAGGTPLQLTAAAGSPAPLSLAPAVVPAASVAAGGHSMLNGSTAAPSSPRGNGNALAAPSTPRAGGLGLSASPALRPTAPSGLEMTPQSGPVVARRRASSIAKPTNDKIEMIGGGALDRALVLYAHTRMNIQLTRTVYAKVIEIPFTSATKVMITVHEMPPNSPTPGCTVILKGAPEYVLKLCTTVLEDQPSAGAGAVAENELTAQMAAEMQHSADEFGAEGERLIAIAERFVPAADCPPGNRFVTNPPNFPVDKLCLLGLVSVRDPPRADVAACVRDCHAAGIQVSMVTGDHQSTAAAIARMVGIISVPKDRVLTWPNANKLLAGTLPAILLPVAPGVTADPHNPAALNTNGTPAPDAAAPSLSIAIGNGNGAGNWVGPDASVGHGPVHRRRNRIQNYALTITGAELRSFERADWDNIFRFEQIVFARTTPDQKLKIVSEAQRLGHIVAVTGDGVNDAPALKRANVGVAMGSASDVAQASADIVLRKNDFASIVRGIEQGRVVFDNLKKVIVYLLPAGSWSEMIPVAANVFLGVPLALSAFLMIVICVLTDVFASLALVHEAAEADIMLREPRDPTKERLVDWKLLLHAYLYIGMLETFAGFLMFGLWMKENGYAPDQWLLVFNDWNVDDAQLNEVVYRGQSIFFVTLVLCQIGNLMSTRTRHVPVLPMPAFLGCRTRAAHSHASSEAVLASSPKSAAAAAAAAAANGHANGHANGEAVAVVVAPHQRATPHVTTSFRERFFPFLLAVAASLGAAIITTEVHWMNDTFLTRPVPAKYWGTGIAAGFCLFFMSEVRKWWFNYWPNGFVAKIAW